MRPEGVVTKKQPRFVCVRKRLSVFHCFYLFSSLSFQIALKRFPCAFLS
jgi:hypothetical protein